MANVVGVLFSLGIFGAVFIRIQFLQVAQGASALKAGGRTMPWTMAPLVVAPLTGVDDRGIWFEGGFRSWADHLVDGYPAVGGQPTQAGDRQGAARAARR